MNCHSVSKSTRFRLGIRATVLRSNRNQTGLLILIAYMAVASTSLAARPYVERMIGPGGREIDIVNVPGSPPPAIRPAPVKVPRSSVAKGIKTLSQVPAFSWCYGCAPTAAAMMMGYYDNIRYNNMYAGPANGGVCPMENDSFWGYGESPLSATHIGIDGRTARGHVEDYWIATGDPGPDPYINNGWVEHVHGDCTADFMGTSQSKFSKLDGSTSFINATDGSPLEDFTYYEPNIRDGCHGLKLFANSRGYTVTANFSQYIYGYNGNTLVLRTTILRLKLMPIGRLSSICLGIRCLDMDTMIAEA